MEREVRRSERVQREAVRDTRYQCTERTLEHLVQVEGSGRATVVVVLVHVQHLCVLAGVGAGAGEGGRTNERTKVESREVAERGGRSIRAVAGDADADRRTL